MFEIEDGFPVPPNEREELVKKVKDGLAKGQFRNVHHAWHELVSKNDKYRLSKKRYLYRHINGK